MRILMLCNPLPFCFDLLNMTTSPIVCWFRYNLRLHDNPPLQRALEMAQAEQRPVIPVFVFDEASHGDWPLGAASKWWLHHALTDLDQQLQAIGSRLLLRQGVSALDVLKQLIDETGATDLVYEARYEPAYREIDKQLESHLGVVCHRYSANYLIEPESLLNQQGKPYQVFTPFWRAALKQLNPSQPTPPPSHLPSPEQWPVSESLEALKLLPSIAWDPGFYEAWDPTRSGAEQRLGYTLSHVLTPYDDGRNVPAQDGTSKLSPYLHWGQISPREVWHAIQNAGPLSVGANTYLSEIGWREFAYQMLYYFPQTPNEPLKEKFKRFPWRDVSQTDSRRDLAAWQTGQTGYPIVDAGMRQLWRTGWMHNRVRMIVGSLLVKHLLLPWQEGARWFWDTLVDADLASNTLGWQWIGGCGADASPYFRVFNPITQGEKFDLAGHYVKHWVPEIDTVNPKLIHKPWESSAGSLFKAKQHYPAPIVDHAVGRQRALEALKNT